VTLAYAAGIILARQIGGNPLPLLILGVALAVVGIGLARLRPWLLWPLLLATGWGNLSSHRAVLSPQDLRNLLGERPAIVTLRGTLTETPSQRVFERDETESWRTMARMQVSAIRMKGADWQPAVGRVAIGTPGLITNFFAGQEVEVTGVAAPPRVAQAPGLFNYRAFLAEQAIYFQLQAQSTSDWRILASQNRPPMADRFRAWARSALSRGLPEEDQTLKLEWALALGWKTALTEEASEPFIQAATYHIFAVDGLRMAIVFGIFFGLLRALGLPRFLVGVLLLPLVWFYVSLTGWPASAIRATVMLSVLVIGWALRRPSDLINSLFLAAFIILLWDPGQLFQAGFQLSFAVVLCMVLIVPLCHDWIQRMVAGDPLIPPHLKRRWPEAILVPSRYFADLTVTSFAAWVGSLPLAAYYFNIITPVSTPANIVAVPLCALVLISNFCSLLLAGWFPGASELFNHAGWFLMRCIEETSLWFAQWPRAYWYVSAPAICTCLLYYGVLLAVATGWLFRPAWRPVKLGALAALLLAWCGLWMSHQRETRMDILPLSGGQAVFVNSPGRNAGLLFNCGNVRPAGSVTKPYLRAQGVNRLPGFVLTHGEVRENGGALLIDGLFRPQRTYASPVKFRSGPYRVALDELEQDTNRFKVVAAGDAIGPWKVLYPEATNHFQQADDNSMVLIGNVGGIRVLLLSDLGVAGQQALLERSNDLRADIVIAGLPARGEALGDELFGAIRPRLIVLVDSDYPANLRASAKLRSRLRSHQARVVFTRFSGAVSITFKKGRWKLSTMDGERIEGLVTSHPP
jgi:competence protein ComEC